MEDLPVFLPVEQGLIYVEMSGDVLMAGTYQINDGLTPRDVIKLTEALFAENLSTDLSWSQPLQTGERLEVTRKGREIRIVQRDWMSASHRMALLIPLHPDRMNMSDWQALSGIGEALAQRIENDRQKNGEFGYLEALIRVDGIGRKRIDSWSEFF